MDRILQFFEEKNYFLEQLFQINEKQYFSLMDNQFEGLEKFYLDREKILEIIKYLDSEIEVESRKTQGDPVDPLAKARFTDLISIKDDYVQGIIHQDLKILAEIDRAKSDILKEIFSNRMSQKAMSAYKNPVIKKPLVSDI